MKFKFSSAIHYYYSVVIMSSILAVAIGIYSNWFGASFLGLESVNDILEASFTIEEVDKNDRIEMAKLNLANDKIEDAVDDLLVLSGNIKKINNIKRIDGFSQLNDSLNKSRLSLKSLISFSKMGTIISVLQKKIVSFQRVVERKDWKTLTRISNRMMVKIKNTEKYFKKDGYGQARLKRLHRGLSEDIRMIKNVTMSSVLSNANKNIVLAKIKTLTTEIEMIEKFLVKLNDFNKNIKTTKINFSNWLEKIRPELVLKKIKFEKRSQIFLLTLIGVITFLILSLGLGYVLNLQSIKNANKDLEYFLARLLRDGVLLADEKFDHDFSESFTMEIDKFKNYVNKRIRFGSVLQQGIPFSSLLLDENLNLIWANEIFYESWNLDQDKLKKQLISWDFLQRFTNLGEDDPVILAVKENIAGIYQIQVKTTHGEKYTPYEMYVSPVKTDGIKQIIIFFYPLVALEETISNQTQSVLAPISKTLDAFIEGSFDEEFESKIAKDYEIAGVTKVFPKFLNYHSQMKRLELGLISDVEKLENELVDKIKLIDDIKSAVDEQNELNKKIAPSLNETKENVIQIINARQSLDERARTICEFINDLSVDKDILLQSLEKSNSSISENKKSLHSIINIKNELKGHKKELDSFVSYFIQSINEILVFETTNGGSENIKSVFTKLKMETKGLEALLSRFSGLIMGLDVGITKIEMVNEELVEKDISYFKGKFESINSEIQSESLDLMQSSDDAFKMDDSLIDSFKSVVGVLKGLREQLRTMDLLINNDGKPNLEIIKEHQADFDDDVSIFN